MTYISFLTELANNFTDSTTRNATTYTGSLTSGAEHGVRFFILDVPIIIPKEQIGALKNSQHRFDKAHKFSYPYQFVTSFQCVYVRAVCVAPPAAAAVRTKI